jgi:transcriptional regulator with XRE-family HTH domain
MNTKSKVTDKTLKEIEKITGIKLSFGKLIWSIRQADELSQIDFATKLKISKQHLCDIEHERKSVSPKLASKYAEILGYSKEQFIRLSLQDLVNRDGLNVQVEIVTIRHRKRSNNSRMAA